MSPLPPIVARSELLIRRAAADVLAAFVDPALLAQFWLREASAPLAVGTTVHWSFLVPGAEADTRATALEADRLEWVWSDGTTVAIRLLPFDDDDDDRDGTRVVLEHTGFDGAVDAAIAAAIDSTQGFTLVLASLKLLLETGSPTSLVADKAALITATLADPG